MKAMQFSIDGGKTWVEADQGVRVIYSNQFGETEDGDETDLHVNLTPEGVILDEIVQASGECHSTVALDFDALNELLVK